MAHGVPNDICWRSDERENEVEGRDARSHLIEGLDDRTSCVCIDESCSLFLSLLSEFLRRVLGNFIRIKPLLDGKHSQRLVICCGAVDRVQFRQELERNTNDLPNLSRDGLLEDFCLLCVGIAQQLDLRRLMNTHRKTSQMSVHVLHRCLEFQPILVASQKTDSGSNEVLDTF